mmetsp:Transcript_18487/g.50485  ORF Transcript_18487/g.50485 Transcript_18487/m.50485 type:complete len:239 (+) Transcript_18487:536-1252(+)
MPFRNCKVWLSINPKNDSWPCGVLKKCSKKRIKRIVLATESQEIGPRSSTKVPSCSWLFCIVWRGPIWEFRHGPFLVASKDLDQQKTKSNSHSSLTCPRVMSMVACRIDFKPVFGRGSCHNSCYQIIPSNPILWDQSQFCNPFWTCCKLNNHLIIRFAINFSKLSIVTNSWRACCNNSNRPSMTNHEPRKRRCNIGRNISAACDNNWNWIWSTVCPSIWLCEPYNCTDCKCQHIKRNR